MMAAMKIHISTSAKEALDAIGGYHTELRGTWTVNIIQVFQRYERVISFLNVVQVERDQPVRSICLFQVYNYIWLLVLQ